MTNCHQLKMHAVDGKMRMTDIADTGQLFRLIQSIPSPKAEPFKLWMAQVTRERLDEMQDPELTIDRAMMEYKRLGYSDNWINQRLKSIEVRKDLTDEPMTNREQNCATQVLPRCERGKRSQWKRRGLFITLHIRRFRTSCWSVNILTAFYNFSEYSDGIKDSINLLPGG